MARIGLAQERLEWEFSNTHHLPAPSSDLWVSAMLDDRKLSARALFDDSSHRQTQLAVQVHTGKTLCYNLPFHVYVSAHMKFDFKTLLHMRQDKQSACISLLTFIHLCCRTQLITSVQLASHCVLRSTIQRVVQCWMKAGQQL